MIVLSSLKLKAVIFLSRINVNIDRTELYSHF